MTPKLFSELGLSSDLLKAIDRLGFEQASPIQAEAIPAMMQGRDIVGQSMTGSGKTAAFGIPAIEKVDLQVRAVQVLILCPTRELAVQVSEEMHKLAFFKRGIHPLPIYGGQSYDRQIFGLRNGAQIVIGTPGRVMDHMRRGTLRLDKVKVAILDEADVMLNMGFRDDIETILQGVPKERQTVFFSATMPRPIRELIEKYSREPLNVKIEQKAMTVPTVEQVYYEVDRRWKIELLTRLIDIHDLKLGIIFCNTKRMVDDLVDHLEAQGYSADRLHGDMTQAMRDRVMNKFRKSGLEFLVATDVAARGIDVDDIEVVFNFDLPYDVEDYVHRIGRTGRAGRAGRAISFASGREVFQIRNIERFINVRIHRARVPTEAEVEEARENVFLDGLRATLRSGEYVRQDALIERLMEEGFSSTDIVSALLHHLQGSETASAPRPARERSDAPPERPVRAQSARAEYSAPAPQQARASTPVRPRPTVVAAPVRKVVTPPSAKLAPSIVAVAEAVAAPVVQAEPAAAQPSRKPEPVLTPKPADQPRAMEPIAAAPEQLASAGAAPIVEPPPVAKPVKPFPVPSAPAGPVVPPAAKISKPAFTKTPAPFVPVRKTVIPPAAKPYRPAVLPAKESPELGEARPVREKAEVQIGDAAVGRRDPRSAGAIRRDPPWKAQMRPAPRPPRTPGDYTRLHMNLGSEMEVAAGDVVGAILGETGLPAPVVGVVDLREKHLFVEVATEHAQGILAKLNRTRIKGRRVKAKIA